MNKPKRPTHTDGSPVRLTQAAMKIVARPRRTLIHHDGSSAEITPAAHDIVAKQGIAKQIIEELRERNSGSGMEYNVIFQA